MGFGLENLEKLEKKWKKLLKVPIIQELLDQFDSD